MTEETELLKRIKDVAAEQANDERLWFITRNIAEAYLQQELRRLHSVIEGDSHD